MASSYPRFVTPLLIALFLPLGCASTNTLPHGDVQEGIASYIHSGLHGNLTASGERYDEEAMTAAHRTLPFGTEVRVTNMQNGEEVIVRINDRGPFVEGRIIDLSRAAAQQLGFVEQGLARVRLEIVEPAE